MSKRNRLILLGLAGTAIGAALILFTICKKEVEIDFDFDEDLCQNCNC